MARLLDMIAFAASFDMLVDLDGRKCDACETTMHLMEYSADRTHICHVCCGCDMFPLETPEVVCTPIRHVDHTTYRFGSTIEFGFDELRAHGIQVIDLLSRPCDGSVDEVSRVCYATSVVNECDWCEIDYCLLTTIHFRGNVYNICAFCCAMSRPDSHVFVPTNVFDVHRHGDVWFAPVDLGRRGLNPDIDVDTAITWSRAVIPMLAGIAGIDPLDDVSDD